MANLSHYNQKNLFGADQVLRDLLDSTDICSVIKKEIAPLIKDTDFEEMYKEGGRPPISPRILALTTVMQYIERLSDRAAVSHIRFRLDWKIAFGLPLDFKGFHSTSLVYFRERILENKKASFVFDKIIEHLKGCGLIKKKSKQRIDSTHIMGCIEELSRVELLHETLRLFCKDMGSFKNQMSIELSGFTEKYEEEIKTHGLTDRERNQMIHEAGRAMKGFVHWVENILSGLEVIELKSYQILKKVFEQNFFDKGNDFDPKLRKVATGKDHICSPHETEARYSNKGTKGWL